MADKDKEQLGFGAKHGPLFAWAWVALWVAALALKWVLDGLVR